MQLHVHKEDKSRMRFIKLVFRFGSLGVSGVKLIFCCQAQFKFSPSSVQFELRLALILVITPTHPQGK